MKITAVDLEQVTGPNSKDVMYCWLDGEAHEFKKGMRITVEGYREIWTVKEIYYTTDYEKLNRKWSVGGL